MGLSIIIAIAAFLVVTLLLVVLLLLSLIHIFHVGEGRPNEQGYTTMFTN